MARSVFRVLVIGLMTVIGLGSLPALAGVVVSAVRILSTREIADEDDMCFWLHPTDLSRSTVISSDKKARSLFVYDLEGHLLQAIASPEPGNVDVRYDFPLGGREVDIVAFNDRETRWIRRRGSLASWTTTASPPGRTTDSRCIEAPLPGARTHSQVRRRRRWSR